MNSQLLEKFYSEMVRIRQIEEMIALKYPEGEMRCPVHLSVGQEAIAVGVCNALRKTDLVLSNHRSHAHYLAKGGDAEKMIAELYGLDGATHGRGGSMYLVDLSVNFLGAVPIVASSIPVASGVALAEKLGKMHTVTAVFMGEAALEEGVTHETLNFALLKKLPILFVCENNLYSVNTHLKDRQPKRSISHIAKAYGAHTYIVDGNDVVAVWKTASQAVSKVRKNQPVFMECFTYRHLEHCGPHFDHPEFRPIAEVRAWMRKDPLILLRRILKNHGISEAELNDIQTSIRLKVDRIFAKAHTYPLPQAVSETDVYAD